MLEGPWGYRAHLRAQGVGLQPKEPTWPQGWLRGPASVPGVLLALLRALPCFPRGDGPGRVVPAGPGPAPWQKVRCKHRRGRAEMFAVGCPVPFGPRRERGLRAGGRREWCQGLQPSCGDGG